MPRPKLCRRITGNPVANVYKPYVCEDETEFEGSVCLTIEEFESLRLGDHFGLYHDECAKMMGISRQTFGNIIMIARKKVADAIVLGKTLRIELPPIETNQSDHVCCHCRHGESNDHTCPQKNIDESSQIGATCCGKRRKRCSRNIDPINPGETPNKEC